MWLHVLPRKGVTIAWRHYLRIAPPVRLVTLLALSTWLPFLA